MSAAAHKHPPGSLSSVLLHICCCHNEPAPCKNRCLSPVVGMWGKGLGDSANTPTLVYVLKGCSPCLSLSPTLSVLRSEMHNVKSRKCAKAFRATCLTRSVLVLCGLGSAGAASHHGRLCDGARRCVYVRPTAAWWALMIMMMMMLVCAHTPCVRVGPQGWRKAFTKTGGSEVAAYLPPPTPHPPFDSREVCPAALTELSRFTHTDRHTTAHWAQTVL